MLWWRSPKGASRQGRRQTIRHGGVEPMLWVVLAALALAGCAPAPKKQDTSDLVWPAPPEDPRIRFLAEYSSADDLKKKDFKSSLLGDLGGGPALQKPYGVAATDDGQRIYVTDTKLRTLMVFDLKKGELHEFKTDARGGLVSPIEVRLDSANRVYVTDSVHAKLNVYDPDGTTVLSLGQEQGMKRPTGLAVDEAHDRIYVSDTTQHRVLVYDLEGNFIREIGKRGPGPGQFNYPVNLAVDEQGNLYVVDTGNFRVQAFDPSGAYKQKFGKLGDKFGSFARPKGIALDSEGHIYVVDAAFNNFQIFEKDGTILLFVGGAGKDPGRFWIPTGIYIDGEDRIYVVDSVNARVQVFQYLGGEESG